MTEQLKFVDIEELSGNVAVSEPEPAVDEKSKDEPKKERKYNGALPEPTREGPPSWVKIPEGMVFPRGVSIVFIRLLPEWTDTPARGERQFIAWANSVGDERLAAARARNDANLILGELSKQMIRAIDGHLVDHSGVPGPGNIDAFWMQIGARCRTLISQVYNRLHILTTAQLAHFLENCIEVRTSG